MLLARHGQSEWNALGRWQGQADPPLSDLGRRQALVAAESVGSVDAVVSSALDRAITTAQIISEAIGVGPVVVEPGLNERDAGEWSGLTKAEIERGWPGYLDDERRPPGFEREGPFRERTLAALDRVHATVGEGHALVVCHGGLIYTVERHLDVPFERIANLGGRWIDHHGDHLTCGERLVLADPARTEITVPDQI
jgi:probable phosphoglycerate mutase